MRVDKGEFTWEFPQLSLLDQTRTRVAWELTRESLHESFLNFHCLIKRDQQLHESWQARVHMNERVDESCCPPRIQGSSTYLLYRWSRSPRHIPPHLRHLRGPRDQDLRHRSRHSQRPAWRLPLIFQHDEHSKKKLTPLLEIYIWLN